MDTPIKKLLQEAIGAQSKQKPKLPNFDVKKGG